MGGILQWQVKIKDVLAGVGGIRLTRTVYLVIIMQLEQDTRLNVVDL